MNTITKRGQKSVVDIRNEAKEKILKLEQDAYKRGFIDKGIEDLTE